MRRNWLRNLFTAKPKVIAQEAPPVCKYLATVVVPGAPCSFRAGQAFVVNIARSAPVRIVALDQNFVDWFMAGSGKQEEPVGDLSLGKYGIHKGSSDEEIMRALGEGESIAVPLSAVYSLMKRETNESLGLLSKGGYATIFFVRDQSGTLRVVAVKWHSDPTFGREGWKVYAHAIGSTGGRTGESVVYSGAHNS